MFGRTVLDHRHPARRSRDDGAEAEGPAFAVTARYRSRCGSKIRQKRPRLRAESPLSPNFMTESKAMPALAAGAGAIPAPTSAATVTATSKLRRKARAMQTSSRRCPTERSASEAVSVSTTDAEMLCAAAFTGAPYRGILDELRSPPHPGSGAGESARLRCSKGRNMAKKVVGKIGLQLNAGKATPAPPVGPALGPYSLNIMAFCKEYNERTQSQAGMVIPVEITVYEDRTFTFVTKTPPASFLIKKAIGIESGSAIPNRNKVGKISEKQLREIAETKMADLNANDVDMAMRIISGTARSMGVEVTA